MSAAGKERPERPRGFWLIYVVYCLILLVGTVGVFEVILRSKGFEPWILETDSNVRIEPGGRLFEIDPALGFVLIPGKFKVWLARDYWFRMTHDSGRLRITRPPDSRPQARDPAIWIFGGSFVHGWSLSDEETFPWRLQVSLPEADFVNFGVSAYGTVQSLMQFQTALKERPAPHGVVLVYASFHDMRNTFSRAWRKLVVPRDRLGVRAWPYVRFDREGELVRHRAGSSYREFPFMRRLALANWLEERYNSLEETRLRSHEASRRLLIKFAETCESRGIRFLVAGVTPDQVTAALLASLRRHGIQTLDISVDLSLSKYSNLPYDIHPSALANWEFQRKLEPALSRWLRRD